MLINDLEDLRLVNLRSGNIVPIALFTIENIGEDGTTIHYTDAAYDVRYKGFTYEHDSLIYGVSPPADTADLTRDLMAVSFITDDMKSLRALWTEHGYTGVEITIVVVMRLGDGIYTEPIAGYKGKCVAVVETIDDKKQLLVPTFGGPLRKLDGVLACIATANNQKTRDETDTALDYIHTTREVGWGRK